MQILEIEKKWGEKEKGRGGRKKELSYVFFYRIQKSMCMTHMCMGGRGENGKTDESSDGEMNVYTILVRVYT